MNAPIDSASPRSGGRRGLTRWLAVLALVTVGALWWGWPTLTGAGDRPPTVVVVTGELGDHREVFTQALRARGYRAQVVVADGGVCDVVATGRLVEASRRIVVADPEPLCDPLSELGSDLCSTERWWWVAPSGVSTQPPKGVTVVDVSWSVGDGGTLRRVCEWWDSCEADGQVTVRSEPGVLTSAGVERVARVVAGMR